MTENSERLRETVAEVAAAYFSNTHVSPNDIPAVISVIAGSLTTLGAAGDAPEPAAEPERQKLTSAQIKKSITTDALISFEDAKPYKTLRRHLASRGLTPEQYRDKYGLPADYPMVAPSYSAARSNMAKSLGLGRGGRGKKAEGATAAVAPAPKTRAPAKKAAAKPKAKRPGRPKKTVA